MIELITAALAMGLSASVYCLASCVPVLLPYTGTLRRPSLFSGLSMGFLYSAGRLIAYSCLLVAFIAIKELVGLNAVVIGVAMLISGLLLLLSAFATFGMFNRLPVLNKILCSCISGAKSPFYLGLMSGFRPCGPLLAALAFAMTLPSVVRMGAFMFSFWLASSVILLVVGGLGGGLTAMAGKRLGVDRIRRIAAIAMVVVGAVLILQSIGAISSGSVLGDPNYRGILASYPAQAIDASGLS